LSANGRISRKAAELQELGQAVLGHVVEVIDVMRDILRADEGVRPFIA
jgi:hypothetical protein